MDLHNAKNSGRMKWKIAGAVSKLRYAGSSRIPIIVGAIFKSRLYMCLLFFFFLFCIGKTVKRAKNSPEPLKVGILGFTSVKKTLSQDVLNYAEFILQEELIKMGKDKIFIMESDLFKKRFLRDTFYNADEFLKGGFKYLIKGIILTYEEEPSDSRKSRVEVVLNLIDISSGRIIFSQSMEKEGKEKRKRLLKKIIRELIIKLINFLNKNKVQIP